MCAIFLCHRRVLQFSPNFLPKFYCSDVNITTVRLYPILMLFCPLIAKITQKIMIFPVGLLLGHGLMPMWAPCCCKTPCCEAKLPSARPSSSMPFRCAKDHNLQRCQPAIGGGKGHRRQKSSRLRTASSGNAASGNAPTKLG